MRILLVEDDKQVASAVLLLLGRRLLPPPIIEHVESFAEARELLPGNSYDLIILDLQLELGVDPQTTFQRMIALAASVPILVLSGRDLSDRELGQLDALAVRFVRKGSPNMTRELLDAVIDVRSGQAVVHLTREQALAISDRLRRASAELEHATTALHAAVNVGRPSSNGA